MAVDEPPLRGREVIPQHIVTYDIHELLAGVDKERALALRLAGAL